MLESLEKVWVHFEPDTENPFNFNLIYVFERVKRRKTA